MKPVRLRAALVSDADSIARLQVAAWRTAFRGLLPDAHLDSLDVNERAALRRRHLESPLSRESRNWVLAEGSLVFGWASTGPARDEDLGEGDHELLAIYLDPAFVGRGHGRSLLQHCLEDARERGFRETVLWVLVGNERAARFYAAAGYRNDERVAPKGFLDTGVNGLRLRREL